MLAPIPLTPFLLYPPLPQQAVHALRHTGSKGSGCRGLGVMTEATRFREVPGLAVVVLSRRTCEGRDGSVKMGVGERVLQRRWEWEREGWSAVGEAEWSGSGIDEGEWSKCWWGR